MQDLEANTKYEFAVRLHLDELSSPWSPVVYESTFPDGKLKQISKSEGTQLTCKIFNPVLFIYPCTAPMLPPSNVKVTLIEGDAALVSWKLPDEPNIPVTHYTILYTTRNAWIAGEWQVLQREGETGKRLKYSHPTEGTVKACLLSQINGPLEISNSFHRQLYVPVHCFLWIVPWLIELLLLTPFRQNSDCTQHAAALNKFILYFF